MLLVSMLTPVIGKAVPKGIPTSLPFPPSVSDEHRKALATIASLNVYQDSDDTNLYYYTPTFRVKNIGSFGASLFFNPFGVSQYSKIQELIAKRDETNEGDVQEHERLLSLFQESLAFAQSRGNLTGAIAIQKMIEEKQRLLATMKGGGYRASEKMRILFDKKIVSLLRQSGLTWDFGINYERISDQMIDDAVNEFARSYGGFLSISIDGKLSPEEIEHIRVYKAKYLPHIRLSALPIEELQFVPVTELQTRVSLGSKIFSNVAPFRNVSGGGRVDGAVLVLDLALGSAIQLAKNIGPFMVPVSIKAKLTRQSLPFHAIIECDFSTGWALKGRTDVIDGAVIFSNDHYVKLLAEDKSSGAGCRLELKSGDQSSAQYAAMAVIEKHFSDLNMSQINMAKADKELYFEKVMRDFYATNAASSRSSLSTVLIGALGTPAWPALGLSVAAVTNNFFWKTTKHDIERLSKTKFRKELRMNGAESVEISVASNLCLVFNALSGAYGACREDDEKIATSFLDAVAKASASEACQGIYDPQKCGEARKKMGQINPEFTLNPT
jgi:hypothetical protein